MSDASSSLIYQLFPIYLFPTSESNVQQIGIVNSAIGITAIIAAPLAGSLVDKFSERAEIVTGFMLNGLGLVTY